MPETIVSIGQSIQIKGDLIGKEDLTIEGTVDGTISLKDHHLTIGPNARVKAAIHAKAVMVVGELVGNITAEDKVELAPTGKMKGDITAPNLVLADGARFKGSVDMGKRSEAAVSPATPR